MCTRHTLNIIVHRYIYIYYVIMMSLCPNNLLWTPKRGERHQISPTWWERARSFWSMTWSINPRVHRPGFSLQPELWRKKWMQENYNFLASSHCSHCSHVQKLRQAATWQGSPDCSQPTLWEAIIKFDCLLHGTRRLFLSLGTSVTL